MKNNLKTCCRCKNTFPKTTEYFYKKGVCLRSECKTCYSIKQKEKYKNNPIFRANCIENKLLYYYNNNYYENNKEKIKENYREKLKTNEDYKILRKIHKKARQMTISALKNTYTSIQWEFCKAYFNNRCAYCGEDKELTMEHFIPVSKGGEYIKTNILPACINCNCSKRNKDFFDWYLKQSFYSEIRESALLQYLNVSKDL